MKRTQLNGLLAAALLLTAANVAEAQVTIGPRIGLNVTNVKYNFDDADKLPDSKHLTGAQVGVAINAQFGNLALQPALLFTMKGEKSEESESITNTTQGYTTSYSSEYSSKLRLNYLEVPVNLVYSTNGADGGFQVFAGPYVAFGLGGKVESEYKYSSTTTYNGQVVESDKKSGSDDTSVKFVSKSGNGDNAYLRNIDAGFNLGIGYKVGGIQAQVGYGLGLGNLIPDDQDGDKPEDKFHNRGFQLNLAYFFGAE